MIRFKDGQPQAVWYSQHATGEAFTYEALEKEGKRVSQLELVRARLSRLGLMIH